MSKIILPGQRVIVQIRIAVGMPALEIFATVISSFHTRKTTLFKRRFLMYKVESSETSIAYEVDARLVRVVNKKLKVL